MIYAFINAVFGTLLISESVLASNTDVFNYGYTTFDDQGRSSFGQPNWGDITCDDPLTCVRPSSTYISDHC
jgi:hypothetical protein